MNYTNMQITKMQNDIEEIKKCRFKASAAFTIVKNAKMIKDAVSTFNDARMVLINSYACKDENGENKIENGKYVIENENEFAKEFSKLQLETQEIIFDKIGLSDISEIEIEATYMETLYEFIEE